MTRTLHPPGLLRGPSKDLKSLIAHHYQLQEPPPEKEVSVRKEEGMGGGGGGGGEGERHQLEYMVK